MGEMFKSLSVSAVSWQTIAEIYTWRVKIAFRKKFLEMADDLASVGQQVTKEIVQQLFGEDGEPGVGNYTKVGVNFYVFLRYAVNVKID